jgi:hypothetical protein
LRRLAAAVLAAAVLLAAGCGGPTDEEQVRAVVDDLGKATAAKDYQALCDHILAPKLIEQVKQIGLPCEVALQRGLGDVKEPKLTVGKITIKDDTATAEIRTVAEGQAPSRDTLELVRVNDDWRIASLGN